MPNKDINYFKSLRYEITIKTIENQYYLYIPELLLLTKNKDLMTAHNELEEKKTEYFRNIIETELQDSVKLPKNSSHRIFNSINTFFLNELVPFLVKAFSLFIIIGLLSLYPLKYISNKYNADIIVGKIMNFPYRLSTYVLGVQEEERIDKIKTIQKAISILEIPPNKKEK